jgi:hypothetical protein
MVQKHQTVKIFAKKKKKSKTINPGNIVYTTMCYDLKKEKKKKKLNK